ADYERRAEFARSPRIFAAHAGYRAILDDQIRHAKGGAQRHATEASRKLHHHRIHPLPAKTDASQVVALAAEIGGEIESRPHRAHPREPESSRLLQMLERAHPGEH